MHALRQSTVFKECVEDWSSAQSLDEKRKHALTLLHCIAKRYAPQEVAVAWTGGKDSTVVLALWREVLAAVHPQAKAVALNLDTGHKFPEIIQFRDTLSAEWDITLHIAKPLLDAQSLKGYSVAQDKVQCCRDLKILPLEHGIAKHGIKILLTGIRADEHQDRARRGIIEECLAPEDSAHLRLHPLFAFSEMDVWSYITMHALPYCSLYTQGYRSLGCVPCTNMAIDGGVERSGRDTEKESAMQSLHNLGYF